MAVLWQKRIVRPAEPGKFDLYQVRSAGRTRRLYTNGVFHSQYNPARPVAGSVWDLLLLPAFFHPPGSVQRVLVLGVGGGAVLKQLKYFIKPELIVGVELNPVHLQVARRFFQVKGRPFQLLEADARDWLQHYQGPAFDLIIDDLFGDFEGEPRRAVPADRSWCELVQRHLAADGSLVMNFDSAAGMRASAWISDEQLGHLWRQRWLWTTPLYANCVAHFTRQSTSAEEFQQHLLRFPELNQRRSDCRLRYSLVRL